MDAILKNYLATLKYESPPDYWAKSQRKIQNIAPEELKQREHKSFRESIQAAAFACGLNMLWAPKVVDFASLENDESDYDSVVRVQDEGAVDRYYPVQLKLVPQTNWLPKPRSESDSLSDLNEQLSKLKKSYPTPQGTIFVIEVNRNITLTNESLIIPQFDAAALFLFGSTSPDRSTFVIIGDLLKPRHQQVGQFSLVNTGSRVMITPA